jgi:hypothetical protein
MARRPNSDAELRALGTFRGRIERANNPRQNARDHNLGRNVRVVEVLTYLALLKGAGKPVNGVVSCVKAARQDFSSPSDMTILAQPTGAMEAAHFVPGTIRIGSTPLWNFSSDMKSRGHIEAVFAAVEHLPTVYNQADTAAEAKGTAAGLCAALAAACQTMLQAPGGSGGVLGPHTSALQAAYSVWRERALTGIRNAISAKGSRGVLPGLIKDAHGNIDLSAREAADSATHNRDDAVRILGYYLEDQLTRDWDWVLSSCRSAIAEATANFRP